MPLAQIALPLAVLIVGAVVYLLATPGPPHTPKIARLAELAYFVGLLWTVYMVSAHVLKL